MRHGVIALPALLLSIVAVPAAAAGTGTTSTAAAAGTATTASATQYAVVSPARLSSRCAAAGAAAIVLPGRSPLVLAATPGSLGASGYPADSSVLSFESASLVGATCGPGSVSIGSLSLFGGAVTASSVTASNGHGSVSGLQVEGQAVMLGPGESTPIEGWGLLIAGEQIGTRLSAPLSLHLLEPRGPLPAGTVILVGFGAKPAPPPAAKPKPRDESAPAKPQPGTTTSAPTSGASPAVAPAPAGRPTATRAGHKKKKRKRHLPLKVTPPLGLPHYVFPVAHGAAYSDTYGGPRSDIEDGWHHGDDLFAPLGTPVVAVASGTLSLVGWNHLGGWRVWLEDSSGNQFYYAHLAAYSRWILDHRHVKAGQVIGFLGRTGDAFTTPPHLHFEIHPQSLLRLGYDGAVDPTSYLETWRVAWPRTKDLPQPAHLRVPKGTAGEEAAIVWRQLLAKRRVRGIRTATFVSSGPLHPLPQGGGTRAASAAIALTASRTAARADAPLGRPTLALLLFGGVAGLSMLAALAVRRGRRGPAAAVADPVVAEGPGGLAAPAPAARQEAPASAGSGSGLLLLAGLGTLATLAVRRARRR